MLVMHSGRTKCATSIDESSAMGDKCSVAVRDIRSKWNVAAVIGTCRGEAHLLCAKTEIKSERMSTPCAQCSQLWFFRIQL